MLSISISCWPFCKIGCFYYLIFNKTGSEKMLKAKTEIFFSLHFIVKLLLATVWLALPTQEVNRFCSVYCVNQQCTAWNSNSCNNNNSSCMTPFTRNTATNLCQVGATSGWTLVDQSTDAGGSITSNFTTTMTCGGTNPWKYKYFGSLTGTAKIKFTDATGPMVPHYQLRIICWIILLDGWSATDQITVTFNGTTSQSVNQINKTSSQTICGSGPTQDYIRIDQTYNHTALAPYTVQVTTNNTSFKWGVKELVVLVKNCHEACGDCWGPLASQCGSCLQEIVIYRLSGTTCNESCLPGYGYTGGDIICVLCDFKCVVCFQLSTNCTQCQSNGTNASFLYPQNFSCLLQCPNTTYSNTTDRICYPCDLSCLSCQYNSTYCYQCDVSLGYAWLNYECITSCPTLYFLSNNGSNCTTCSPLCSVCHNSANNCSSCTLSGTNMAYLSGTNTCVQTCPNNTYPDTNGGTVNRCLQCDISCLLCTAYPSPCSQCASTYYFYQNTCSMTCPTDYFGDNSTWTCLACDIYCVDVQMKMYFPTATKDKIYVDLVFTDDLDFMVFPYQTYQSFTLDSDLYTLDMFNISYEITGTNSYRVIIQPKGYIFLYNQTIKCTLMNPPNPTHISANSRPFKKTAYSLTASLVWFVIKSPELSDPQKQIIQQMTTLSDKINSLTTQPYVQELKKSGLFMFLLGGAQITSCSVLVNNIPAQNMYSGVRFWASFVFFDVPDWQQNSNSTKYFLVEPVENKIKNARLLEQRRVLFDVNGIQWRFLRTGHTSFFMYDTYPIIALLTLCWLLILITHLLSKHNPKFFKSHAGKLFTFIHKSHQISIMYIYLHTILQWLYFNSSSMQRWLSLSICILVNIYFLLYQLYIYYDMMKYPVAQIGNIKFQYYGIRYGCYLKNIRYEQYKLTQPWSPKYWFRPYNYHILSYYKKLLMIASLPLFYHITHAQPAILALIQICQILRFCYIWPFSTKWRNFMRLVLELVLLGFFVCVLIEGFLVQEIMRNDQATLSSTVEVFYKIGWIGFGFVFIFNTSFILLALIDLIRGCSLSNMQLMQKIRYDFYYAKLQQYETQNIDVPSHTINKWIKLGNLNQYNYQELPTIYVRIEYVRFGKVNNTSYEVQVKKLYHLQLREERDYNMDNNIVGSKYDREFTLTRAVNRFYFGLAEELFELYATKTKLSTSTASTNIHDHETTSKPLTEEPTINQTQYLTIKTFLLVDQSLYKPGQPIQMDREKMSQKIEIQTYSAEKRTIKLDEMVLGFPISIQNLNQIA